MKKCFDLINSQILNISLLKEKYYFHAELVSFQAELVNLTSLLKSILLNRAILGLNALSLPPSFVGSANWAFRPIRVQYRSVKKYKLLPPSENGVTFQFRALRIFTRINYVPSLKRTLDFFWLFYL